MEDLYALASQAFAESRMTDAQRLCSKLLAEHPQHVQGLVLSATLCRVRNDAKGAVTLLRAALSLKPHSATVRYHLAENLETVGESRAALGYLESLTKDRPDIPQAWLLMSRLLVTDKRYEEAVSALEGACMKLPNNAEIFFALASALQKLGRLEEAANVYQKVIVFSPNLQAAHNNLGLVQRDRGYLSAAAEAFSSAILCDPTEAVVHRNLGMVLTDMGRTDEAIVEFELSAKCDPDDAETPFALGSAFATAGHVDRSIKAFETALSRNSEYFHARWGARLSLPILYAGQTEIEEWQGRWAEGLVDIERGVSLESAEGREYALRALGTFTNFYLPYQGAAHTDLQSRLGVLMHKIASACFPGQEAAALPPARGRKRVVFVSSLFRTHTVSKLFRRWVTGLDREQFDVWVIYSGRRVDDETRGIGAQIDRLITGVRDPARLVKAIQDARPDVLIYPDLGMDPIPQSAAALRLAPRQYLGWGHPVTSGLPTIDGFLTSDAMEPVNGESHYTESLIRLPGLSVDFARPPIATRQESERWQDNTITYLCSQSLYKLLPQFDYLFARIAASVPNSKFLFIGHKAESVTQKFWVRLETAFKREGLTAEAYCEILPRCSQEEFFALNQKADIGLDSVMWSGGVTTFEAVASGLPVVTWPGPFMRSRHTAAILRHIGLDDLVADDLEDYVAIATRLGREPDYRLYIRDRLNARADLAFENVEPIRALNRFLAKDP